MTPGYVVNPGGAVHSVEPAQVEALLQQGFRRATPAEIAAWYRQQGLPVPEDPPLPEEEALDAAGEHGRPDQSGAHADRRPRRR